MAARAIWKGVIRFGDVEVPVKLYSAVQDRSVHFRLLAERTENPVKQKMVEPVKGREVPDEKIRRGYETEPGVFVILDEEDLEELEPKASRDIEVTRFVPPEAIEHAWYLRPYWLGPDGDDEAYFALAEALRKEEREAIARWTMRKKEYHGALRLEGDHLMLITMRHAGEIIQAAELPAPSGRKLDEREVRMAKQLIDMLADEFDPAAYQDEYRERVEKLVEAKAAGGTVEVDEAPATESSGPSLRDALAASVKAAKEKKSAA